MEKLKLIKSLKEKLKSDNPPEVAKALKLKIGILEGNKTVLK